MKKVSAAFVILAVLNPFCCCWTFADSTEAKSAEAVDQACCAAESKSPKSPKPGHDPANCEHQAIKDSVVKANTTISLPDVPIIPASSLFKESEDLKSFQSSLKTFESRGTSEPFIEKWISVQTDCVRRL